MSREAKLKGNRNGEKAWVEKKGEERLVMVNFRIPESHRAKIESMLQPGQSKSELLREAIAYYLRGQEPI